MAGGAKARASSKYEANLFAQISRKDLEEGEEQRRYIYIYISRRATLNFG